METESTSCSPKQTSESDDTIEIEFDGNTVLCRVCGDRASGFHYGVHACEGCKGFFRRSIQQKIQYRPCLKNQLCLITRVNRNRCQYCRLKKCIAVGMSRDAVRFGRVPKREKAKIMEQMQKVNIQCHGSMLDAVLSNESELQRQIVEAHMKTCEFTRANFDQFYQKAWAHPDIVHCPAHMACPLNPYPDAQDGAHKWDHFSDCFMPAIRNVVSFAKCIPGFSVLSQEDQVTLLKAGTFEVLLVHLACLFDAKNNTMLFTNGKIFRRTSMSFSTGAGYLLDSMFDFAERFNELNLTDEEVALFSALVIISSDRPGLRGPDLVEKLHASINRCLQIQMKVNHNDDPSVLAKLVIKVSELRLLNTVHSEKLLGLSVPSAEPPQVPSAFPSGSGCHGNNQMHFCFGNGYRGASDGSALELRGAGFEFVPHDLKSEDCGSKGEAIDLRGQSAGAFVRGASWWSTNQMLVNGDRDEKVGAYKSKMLHDDIDGRQRSSLPNKVLGDSNWLSNGVTNSDEKLPFSSHLSSPTSSHSAIQASTNSSSIIAHPSGTSIVARQVMMKTVQQEVILTTPVGTFHRTPLNLWTSAGVSTSNGRNRKGHRDEELEMEAEDGKRRDRQQPWKMTEDDEDAMMPDNSVISAKKKVMRTWSEDTSSSKVSCSSCCNSSSSKNMDVDVHSVTSLRPVDEEQMDESLDDGSSSGPDDEVASLQKAASKATTLECIDLPVRTNALSSSLACPYGDQVRDLRMSNGCQLIDSTSANGFQKQQHATGDQFGDQRGMLKSSSSGDSSSSGLLMSFVDDRYRNAFIRSSATSPDSSCVTTEQTPRSLSSAFTAENLLRPNPNARNMVVDATGDREAHLTTKATLKERLLKRIDSKDNVNSVEPTVGNGAPTRPDPAVAQRMDAFPLQFLHDYPRFYPLGFPGGLHPSILYNHLALQQHLQAVKQQQQQLQVQAQLTHAAMLGGMLPKMAAAAAAAENGPAGLNAATGRSVGSPVLQSSSSEHLSLDDRSNECEEIKHLNTPAEHLSAQQSPLLVKSEMA